MSWLYSAALVEEFLGESYLDGEQYVPSSGNPTLLAFCAPDKMTAFSRISSRYGTMFKPLMDNLGEDLLMSCRAVSLVRTYQSQEKEPESKVSEAECGEKWRGSFVKYNPDSSSWKTHQCSLLEDLEEFSETWPQWGLMRDGECWEQQTLERTIRGTGYGLSENIWATPTTMDKLPPKSEKALSREATISRPGRSKPANLRDQVSNMENWPTPNAWDAKRGPMSKELMETGKHQISLVTAVRHNPQIEKLPTPTASDYKDQPTSKSWKEKGAVNYKLSNPEIRAKWAEKPFPTPLASDWKGRGPNSKQQGLSEMVKWGTPKAQDSRHALSDRGKGNLGEQVSGIHNGGKLNPPWVEWLMGWPIGWTDLKPLVMDKSAFALPPHGES